MKLSIWQQFSSNHSSDFTIIGVFDTAEKANNAVETLRGILARISTWHNDHPEKAQELYEQWADGDLPVMSPVERQIAQEYGVHWVGGIDWFNQVTVSVALDRLVLIMPQYHTDYGPEPFDQIINRLGGYAFFTGEDDGGESFGQLTVKLRCVAPDAVTVEAILAEKQPQFLHDEPDTTSPSVLRVSGLNVSFQWDYEEGEWELESLIDYLRGKGCRDITYQFQGQRITRTEPMSIPEETSGDQP